MAGLLDTFSISKRGLAVQQSNINTSSHNIANANTEGFSRQRSVIQTTRPFGGNSKWEVFKAGQVGTGAEVAAIQRVRDLFLDYQVREKNTESGTLNLKYQYLYQTENILNDSSDAGIQNALNQFFNAFQEISKAPEKSSNRDVAIKQASALADMLNSKYTQLESKKEQAQKLLQQNVTEINNILDSINSLNKQISSVCALGMTPNDLMDQRDKLLDDLSAKFGIDVKRDKYETIDVKASEATGLSVTVKGKDANGNNIPVPVSKFVASSPNDEYLRFSYISDIEVQNDGTLKVSYQKLGNTNETAETITITGAGSKAEGEKLKKELLESRVIVTDKNGNVTKDDGNPATTMTVDAFNKKVFSTKGNQITQGEIAGNQSAQKTIQKAMDELDKLAISIAYTVNAIQTGDIGNGTTSLTKPDGTKYTADLLFVNKENTTTKTDSAITAKNISINEDILKDSSKLICGENVSDISGDKAGTRALAIADLAKLKIDYSSYDLNDYIGTDITRKEFFDKTGITFKETTNLNLKTDKEGTTLKDYYISITSDLGLSLKNAKENLSTVEYELQSFEEQRLSISGVSIDEEMTDLITFQHAYQANAKMINTIDQLLDVVINGLKA